MVTKDTMSVQIRDKQLGSEEIQKVAIMHKDSIIDSKRFRRSQRLQSILGKMRDSRDEECNQVQSKLIQTAVVEISDNQEKDNNSTAEEGSSTCIESERRQRAVENTPPHEEETTPELQLGKVDEVSISENREETETREDPTVNQEREDQIREQINVAIKDSMIGSIREAQTPNTISTGKFLSKEEPDTSPRRQRVQSPKSPKKRVTARKSISFNGKNSGDLFPTSYRSSGPSRNTASSPKSVSSPRGGKRASPQSKMVKNELHEDSSESESSNDEVPTTRRYSRTKKAKFPISKEKSISSDDSTKDSSVSSESSESDAASKHSNASSTDGYSSSSSTMRLKNDKLPRKGDNLEIDTKDLGKTQSKVTSPITEQASDFIKNLVRNLKLHQAFSVPEKVKNHAKSQPIKSGRKSTISAKDSDESESDQEVNSIIKKNLPPSKRAQPVRRQFKLTTLPRKDVMEELREKLAQRHKKIEGSGDECIAVEQKVPLTKQRRQKLTSQVLKETDRYVETIPRLVSTDTLSTRSRQVQVSDSCGANCGTLLCFGSSTDIPKPLRIKWQQGDFLTMKEALLALDDSDKWDGASTMASMRGPTFSAEELSTALANRKRVPREITAYAESESASISKRRSSGSIVQENSKLETVDRNPYSITPEDDATSLVYSVATEEGEEQHVLESGSDDSSMVPLRHGERESLKPSRPKVKVEMLGSAHGPPSPEKRPRRKSLRESSDELVIALSLSEDSNDLIPSPEGKDKIQHTSPVELDPPNRHSQSRPGNIDNRSTSLPTLDGHHDELFAKIHEFQQRRESNGVETSPVFINNSVNARTIKRQPVRTDFDLPKASKKVAQAYVAALSKKFEGNAVTTNSSRPVPTRKPPPDSTTLAGNSSEELIPLPNQNRQMQSLAEEPLSNTKKIGVQSYSAPSPRMQNHISSAFEASDADQNAVDSKSTATAPGVNVDDLVLRIDNVVQRLIEAGKIDPAGNPCVSTGSELEQRTLRSNTQELLQNLAILRARRSFGASTSRHSQAASGASSSFGGESQVTRSSSIRLAPVVTPLMEPPIVHHVGKKSLQDLRAKRDQAAMAVRMSAQRLSGMSRDFSENTNILQETPRGRSFSTAKFHGPPKPEHLPSRPLSRSTTPLKPKDESLSKMVTTSSIPGRNVSVATEDLRGSYLFPITLPDSLTSDLGAWEQEQLQELPVLLQTTFSGLHTAPEGSSNVIVKEMVNNDIAGSEVETKNSCSDDETTDCGSDVDSERLLRIESMIHELRARRLLRF